MTDTMGPQKERIATGCNGSKTHVLHNATSDAAWVEILFCHNFASKSLPSLTHWRYESLIKAFVPNRELFYLIDLKFFNLLPRLHSFAIKSQDGDF